jgi:hypothetical protein
MAFTLSNLLQGMYTQLGQGNKAIATGGSTTSVVDTLQNSNSQYDNWILFIASTTDGLAPIGEYKRVSAYSAGTFTPDSAFSAAVGAGDAYLLVSTLYPLQSMIQSANDGLRSLGPVVLTDTTTLTYVPGQSEYPAQVVWKRTRPFRIDIQSNPVTNDNEWVEVNPIYWDFIPSTPGTTGLIIFNAELNYNHSLRIWYLDAHPTLNVFSDVISETINEQVAVQAGVLQALVWQNGRQQGGSNYLLQRQNQAVQDLQQAQAVTPIWKPRRRTKLVITQ